VRRRFKINTAEFVQFLENNLKFPSQQFIIINYLCSTVTYSKTITKACNYIDKDICRLKSHLLSFIISMMAGVRWNYYSARLLHNVILYREWRWKKSICLHVHNCMTQTGKRGSFNLPLYIRIKIKIASVIILHNRCFSITRGPMSTSMSNPRCRLYYCFKDFFASFDKPLPCHSTPHSIFYFETQKTNVWSSSARSTITISFDQITS